METKKIIVICFTIIVIGAMAAFFLSKKEEPKHVIIVAKFADVNKYVVVRQSYGVHVIVKVNDKTYNHMHVGDSILYAGN